MRSTCSNRRGTRPAAGVPRGSGGSGLQRKQRRGCGLGRGRERGSHRAGPRRPSRRRTALDLEAVAARRILILGEGFSHDPHYGKTMRGIVRYGPDPVVAILDSKRAGETHEGIPVVGSAQEALRYGPTVAVVGVATQGGRFPAAWR